MKLPVILRVYHQGAAVAVRQFETDMVVIGHHADVQLELDHQDVSNIHCLIERRDSGYYLCDLGSTTGTYKNGVAVLDEPLSSGDKIQVGPYSLQFFVGAPKPKVAPPTLTVKPVAPPTPPSLPENSVVSDDHDSETVLHIVRENPQQESASVVRVTEEESPKKIIPLAKPRPELPSQKPSSEVQKRSHHKKGGGTYAPGGHVENLQEYLRPTKGSQLEILVCWQDRITASYHFQNKKVITIGSDQRADVQVPSAYFPQTLPLIDANDGFRLLCVASATVDLITNQQHYNIDDLLRLERAVRLNAGYAIRFDSGEMLHLSFDRGNLQIFIRLIPESVQPILASPFDLTVGEMTGVVLSVVLCAILGFLFSVSKPEEVKDLDNQPPRIAQFIYEKKPETPKAKPIELTEKEQPVPPPPPEQEKKPLKKVELSDKDAKSSAKKATVMTQHQKPLVKASEIREKNSNLKSPTFGSVKQGGSVKISNQESANAATVKKDISKQGLLGALSNNGLRDKLDQTYSGNNKGALGLGSQATGKVGLNQDHAGSDIGDKFRETGAGGKGTSTVGINSNLGTKGKSSGQDSYGNTGISTSKGTVAIESGGFEENFVGSIDKEAVRRVVKAGLREVKACYERGLRANSRLEGKVIVSWEIVEKGHVGSASVKSSTLNNKEVESCIVARLKSWQFPEPPAGTSAAVSYPFSFVKQQ